MTNSGGIVQKQSWTYLENIRTVKKKIPATKKQCIRTEVEEEELKPWREIMENKYFSEVAWLQFTLTEGWTGWDLKSLLALHFYYFFDLLFQNVTYLRQVRNQRSAKLLWWKAVEKGHEKKHMSTSNMRHFPVKYRRVWKLVLPVCPAPYPLLPWLLDLHKERRRRISQ